MSTTSIFSRSDPLVPTRAVHVDLKGCPPTAQRLMSLLKIAAAARYNAVLVEWEDMFPWTVDQRFRCETAYSAEDIRAWADEADRLGIELIPVVQCLGHMETPLSVPGYENLREVPDGSSVLNPLAPGARQLVERMVDDVLSILPRTRRFHLGGDEAWSFGTHADTKAYVAQQGAGALYLHHVEPILVKLNERNIRPLLWHDMMVEWDSAALRRLATQADLVVWGYSGHPDRATGHCKTAFIERLHAHGLHLWGAGAYKGADGHSGDVPDLARRQENALAWAELAGRFDFCGLIATAWSRYSTHNVQNEPIDAALDSLILLGVIFHDGAAPRGGVGDCEALLGELGEHADFTACREAMQKLANLRRRGWQQVRDLSEFLVTLSLDSRRRGSKREIGALTRLRDVVTEADGVAQQVQQALAGLMQPLWVERYLAERIEPLRLELAALEPRASALTSTPQS